MCLLEWCRKEKHPQPVYETVSLLCSLLWHSHAKECADSHAHSQQDQRSHAEVAWNNQVPAWCKQRLGVLHNASNWADRFSWSIQICCSGNCHGSWSSKYGGMENMQCLNMIWELHCGLCEKVHVTSLTACNTLGWKIHGQTLPFRCDCSRTKVQVDLMVSLS